MVFFRCFSSFGTNLNKSISLINPRTRSFKSRIIICLELPLINIWAIATQSLSSGSFVFESLELVLFYFIISTLYGIAWGYLVVKCGNVIPSIIAHYWIDAFGLPFISIGSTDQAIIGTFFLSISCLYLLITIILLKYFFRK